MPLAVSAAVCVCVGRSLTLMRSVQQWRPSGAQVGTELSFPCITAPPGLPSLRCGLRAVWVMFSCTDDTSDLNSVVCGVLKQKREQPEATSACRTQPVFNQHSSVLSLEQEQQLSPAAYSTPCFAAAHEAQKVLQQRAVAVQRG